MLNEHLNYLTITQIDYMTIHIRNLIEVAVLGNKLNDVNIRQELLSRQRFLETYKTKYHIDNNTQKELLNYYEKIAIPKLYINNESEVRE